MGTWTFWERTLERAGKTFAQTALLAIGANAVSPGHFNVLDAAWANVIGLACGGFVLSLLTSMASSLRGDPDSPSIVD